MNRDDYDLDGDRLHCGICGCVVTPANFAAWDPWDVFCAHCQAAAELEYGVDEGVGAPTEAEYRRAMTTSEALGLAVEVAMGGRNLLNGADEECDECEPRGHEPTGLISREDAVRIGGGAPEVTNGPSANEMVSGGLSRTHRRGGNAGNVSPYDEEEADETCETVIDACPPSGSDLMADGTLGRKAAA